MDGPQTTPEKPSLLPVPWSSPWKQLRQDLARDLPAVGSASVLRLRELWRRNREGDLSVPGFWPQALSAWFWPLLLAVALSLPLLLGRGTTPAPAVVLEQPLPVEQQLQQAFEPTPPAPQPLPAAEPEVNPLPLPAEPLVSLDPLLALLDEGSTADLIASIHPLPDQGVLELTPSDGFAALSTSARQQQADHWLDLSRSIGYDNLQLVDATGKLVGRSAQVGEGMILWNLANP
ncbi:putative conserved membrane protein [Synechococcus sp. Minos11]|uniref:hypothetical protein n=1 Tax=Synechococcus sp. Minos11 TaxID=221341 RepID=UPI001646698A|nr:hypothetical protein [Synechococcus sp. Minos11]QNJ08714.1 putative conserved membrane protein [Synechococcus sp. Minos11]